MTQSLDSIRQELIELRRALAERIVGQDEVITQVLAALVCEGHCLVVGVPGLAKTLLFSSIAELLGLDFKRIQFTPDLMPSDITGASVIREDSSGSRAFHFLRGPIFANLILADEINRTPPKTQAALMEAMEERQVSAGGRRQKLERPFFVLATQNPIEQQGTYPLPVSQLDRFLFNITIDYPTRDEEFEVLLQTTSTYQSKLERSFSREDVLRWITAARNVETNQALVDAATAVVRATRPDDDKASEFVRSNVTWGGGPRATQSLISGARAVALMDGRGSATVDDMAAIAVPTLRHRMRLGYHAAAEGVQIDSLIENIVDEALGRSAGRDTVASPAG